MSRPLGRLLRRLVSRPLAAAALLLAVACVPVPGPEEDIPFRVYRDTLLQVEVAYPEGWTFTDKTSYSLEGRVFDLAFEPSRMEWTRRFAVKVVAPDRPREERILADLKEEVLERLGRAEPPPRLDDTAAAVLGGHPAFLVRYTTFLDGKPFVRHMDILSRHRGRDVALSFEVADAHAAADIVLFRKVTDRFRFDPP